MTLPDGRRVVWSEYGDPDGVPVMALHGTPSSRLDFLPAEASARRFGLRLIAPDRPGMGDSDPHPDRTLLGYAADVGALADHLGIGRFAIVGFSGGGPYALACALALGDGVTGVVGASAAGPVDGPGGLAGMSITDKLLTILCLRAPTMAIAYLKALAVGAKLSPHIAVWGEAAELGPDALGVLKAFGTRKQIMAPFHASVRQGARWPIQDFALLSRPWGLALDEIRVPVRLFHGTADRVVPLSQARHLAAEIPTAVLTEVRGVGHVLLHRDPDLILSAVPR